VKPLEFNFNTEMSIRFLSF